MAEDLPEKKRALGALVAALVVVVGVLAILYYLIGNAWLVPGISLLVIAG